MNPDAVFITNKRLVHFQYTFWEDEIMKADFCKRKPLNDLKRPGTALAKYIFFSIQYLMFTMCSHVLISNF